MEKDSAIADLYMKPIEKAPFYKLDIKPQQRFTLGRGKVDSLPVWAMDTETYTKGKHKGDVFLIADSLGNKVWKPSLYQMLKFLMLPCHIGKMGFAFNLRFDGEGVLKEVKEETLKAMRLHKKQRTAKLSFSGGRGKKSGRAFTIQWRGSKGMKIMENRKLVRLSDLPPFYPGLSLGEAGKIFLGEGKKKIKGYDFTPESVEKRKQEIIEYCKKDAELTARLGELTQKRAEERGIFMRDYPSPASLGERFLCKEAEYIVMTHPRKPSKAHPDLLKMNFEETYSHPLEYAWNAFGGGWFECCKRGYFPKLYKYDINSAFPAVSKTLVNIDPYFDLFHKDPKKRGFREWIYKKGKPPEREFVRYGFIKADIDIRKDVYLSPIPYRVSAWGAPLIIYPIGKFRSYVTLNEFDFINENLGTAKAVDGFYFLCDPNTPEALYKPITKLYKEKQRLKLLKNKDVTARVDYEQVKLFLNAAGYGKFIQKTAYKEVNERGEIDNRFRTGNLFNPVWACIITSEVRLQLARAILGREHIVVMIATDGILTTEPLDLPLSKKLGGWTCEEKFDCVVVKSGVYQSKGECPELKTRGFKPTFGTLKNRYTDLHKYLKDYPEQKYIVVESERPLTMNECLLPSKKTYNIHRVNEFIPERKRFFLQDDKRVWGKPIKCKDLLTGVIDSIPQPAPTLTEEKIEEDIIQRVLDGKGEDYFYTETLTQRVMKKGGIRLSGAVTDFGKYSELPLCVRRKTGLPFDEMADELKISDNELWEGLI